jgi:steroid delta-isomerase-like uncharacterized protein
VNSENKSLVRRFYEEVWNRGHTDVALEVFTDDYVRHDLRPAQALPGGAGQAKVAADFRTAFPDLSFHVDLLVAEDDLVAARWTASGTHAGMWGDVAPSGNAVTFSGVNFFRIRDGKVVEIWNHRDDLGLMEQTGAAIYAGAAPRRNVDVVRRFYESWNEGSIDFDELVAEDIVNHQPEAGPEHGRRSFEEAIGRVMAAVPDSNWEIVDLLADADRVVVRANWSGTYGARQFRDVPIPVPAAFSAQHIHIYRLADGKLAEHWVVRDDLTMLRQLGAVGATGQHRRDRD